MDIPGNLTKRIDEVIEYVGDTTEDYLKVKRQLINNFPPSERPLFSVRHPCTKKHLLNAFDEAVILYWESKTGVRLWVSEDKLHDPNWKQKKRGWALSLINQERKCKNLEIVC